LVRLAEAARHSVHTGAVIADSPALGVARAAAIFGLVSIGLMLSVVALLVAVPCGLIAITLGVIALRHVRPLTRRAKVSSIVGIVSGGLAVVLVAAIVTTVVLTSRF
jgi:hypothetical protein